MIEAQVICDSLSHEGHRLTTFQLRYPKFIHGEFMTHRVFSRNASSSRAVPTAKLIEEVRSDELRATPVFWGRNQSGMQDAGEMYHKDRAAAMANWAYAAKQAADNAEYMASLGAHKQIVNRIIEPFTHINVVVTATEYANFFGLRLHKDADPTMRALAELMWKRYTNNVPKVLRPGEWHLPYVDILERDDEEHWKDNLPIKISVARCARVSYTSHETGKISTPDEDLKLYERLLAAQPLHASPAEHQATPDEFYDQEVEWLHQNEWGNFRGWRQYRKMLAGEAIAPLPEGYVPF